MQLGLTSVAAVFSTGIRLLSVVSPSGCHWFCEAGFITNVLTFRLEDSLPLPSWWLIIRRLII